MVQDFFYIASLAGLLVSLAYGGLFSAEYAALFLVPWAGIRGLWSGASRMDAPDRRCLTGCLFYAGPPVIGMIGFVLAHTVGDPIAAKVALSQFAVLVIVVFAGIYLPLRAVGSTFRPKR